MAGSTGLEQQHLIARVCRKAVRDRGTSRTGADDNVIVGLHLSCSPSAPTLSTQALYAKGMIKPARGWRRERDSNPRYGFPYTRSPGVRLQPLGHPSSRLFRGAAEGNERAPDAQSGACRAVGPCGRAVYDFRSGPARAMTCISPSAPAIATL